MNKSETAKVVAVLQGNYNNVTLTEDSVSAYHVSFAYYDYETVMRYLPVVMRQYPEFCPNVPLLLNAIDECLNPTGSTAEAWEAIASERKRCGTWHVPVFADPVVERVAKAIGWETICGTQLNDEGTLRAQVRDMYKTFAIRASIDRVMDAVEGGGVNIVQALRDGRRPESPA